MPININVKYFKRWNASLNNNAGGWEYFAFKTPISAIVDDSSNPLLPTSSDRALLHNLNENLSNVYDDIANVHNVLDAGTAVDFDFDCTYYPGQIVIENNIAYMCIEEVETSDNEGTETPPDTASGLSAYFVPIGVLPAYVTSAISGKMNTSDWVENDKIKASKLPDVIAGQLVYGGTVNGSTMATGTLTDAAKARLGITGSSGITLSDSAASGSTSAKANEGIYYIVATAGGTFSGSKVIDDNGKSYGDTGYGSMSLQIGDWILGSGGKWVKIDNTDAVKSVNGHTGNIYTFAGVTSDTDDIDNLVGGLNKGDIFFNSSDNNFYICTEDLATPRDNYSLANGGDKVGGFIAWALGNPPSGVTAATNYANGPYCVRVLGGAEATSSQKGIAKLYNSTGNNTDGAITQGAATSAINDAVADRVVYLQTGKTEQNNVSTSPSLPTTKYTGLIVLADE